MRKNDGKRTFCPIDEIDWGFEFHRDRRPVLGNSEPDPEGELLPQELMIKRYTAGYPDEARKNWIARKLKDWWQGREG